MKLSRRSFLGFSAASACALLLPEIIKGERTFFLPPKGGWRPADFDPRYPRGDVRRYGAVGDGITDDSISIQAAIDDIATTSFNGVVLIPGHPYHFKLNNDLHLWERSQSLFAEGKS